MRAQQLKVEPLEFIGGCSTPQLGAAPGGAACSAGPDEAVATTVRPLTRGRRDIASDASETEPKALFELVYRQMSSLSCDSGAMLDDLVQVAFEHLLRALPSFRHESELSTFAYGICYRTLLKERRWHARWLKRFTLTRDGELPERHDSMPDAEESLEEFERYKHLRRAVQALPPKRRAVVVLCDLEGMAVDVVADVLGTKVANVRSRLRDGRRQLKSILGEDPYFGRGSREGSDHEA